MLLIKNSNLSYRLKVHVLLSYPTKFPMVLYVFNQILVSLSLHFYPINHNLLCSYRR